MTFNTYLQYPAILWLDTETTGVATQCDICELSGCLEINGQLQDEFTLYARPFSDTHITSRSLVLQGITETTLYHYPPPQYLYVSFLQKLSEYPQQLCFAGHHISFDLQKLLQFQYKVLADLCFQQQSYEILYSEYDSTLFKSRFCTYEFARKIRHSLHLAENSNSLQNLAEEFHCGTFRPHHSLDDAKMARSVAYALLNLKHMYKKK